MTPGPFLRHAGDLAPGDLAVLEASWEAFDVETLRSASDPGFDDAWGRLWHEFGDRGEMERREVIRDRLAWDPAKPVSGHALLYELVVVRRHGEVVAVRDHTAIVTPAALAGDAGASIVVHLSHVLVEPSMRGRGLASWMRALPVAAARRCHAAARRAAGVAEVASPGEVPGITLVAEMDPDDGVTPAIVRRLRSYARAGFRVLDPARVHYLQPDFRSAADIDRSSVQSVPLSLVLRRVGREHEATMPGREARELVAALAAMFAVHVRADHMEDVRRVAATMPGDAEDIALLVPGAPAALREEEAR